MKSNEIVDLAIKRHDIDADDFQETYNTVNKKNLTKRKAVFLYGRQLVLDELAMLLEHLPKGSRVLDVGCGTAHLTHWIKEKGFEVCGIEPSDQMLGHARKNYPDIEIKQAISSSIPYEDNQFDLIVAFEVLRYLDTNENQKTFEEFNRVLKPGGQFFVTQVNRYSTDFYYWFHQIKAELYKRKNITHHHCNFTTSKFQEAQVKAAGFSEVKTVGRFLSSIRLFYKLGKGVGSAYSSFLELFSKKQRFVKSSYKNLTGHLIVIGKK